MKQKNKWLTAIAALLCSITVNAATEFTVDGIKYTVASTDGTCSVSGYDESFGTEVVIPLSVDYRSRTFSVTSIGNYAFYGCSSLTSITLPEGVTSIGKHAFEGCSSLTSISIPEGVTSIENYAFSGCTSFKEIIFEDGSETLTLGCNDSGRGLFSDCPLENVYLGRNLNYESDYENGYSPLYKKTSLTSVTIGDSVTSIGNSAFKDCTSLTSITLPEGVTSIGNGAFSGCTSFKEIIFEDGSETLTLGRNYSGRGLFSDCPLENVYLGRNLNYESDYENGYSPLYKKTSLTSVTIGDSVTSIGKHAFEGCSSLTSISCLATTPPTIYKYTFDSDAYNFADLFVPQGTKDAYQAATGWKNFYFINDTLPSGIDNITVGQSPKIYDLNGRELQAPQQGINIVGGRKVLVK